MVFAFNIFCWLAKYVKSTTAQIDKKFDFKDVPIISEQNWYAKIRLGEAFTNDTDSCASSACVKTLNSEGARKLFLNFC